MIKILFSQFKLIVQNISTQFHSTTGLIQIIGIVFAIFIIPTFGYFMKNPKIVTISIAVGFTLIIWFIAYYIIQQIDIQTNKIVNSNKTNKNQNSQTLEYYFKSDFNHLLKISLNKTLAMKSNASSVLDSVNCIIQLYADFDAQSCFLGYYIPKTPLSYLICKKLIEDNSQILSELLKSRVEVQQSSPGEKPTELKNLKFSGRIYIYNNNSLFESEMENLINEFRLRSLFIQFRSIDYLFAKKSLVDSMKE